MSGKKTLTVKKMQALPVAEDLKVKAKVKAGYPRIGR